MLRCSALATVEASPAHSPGGQGRGDLVQPVDAGHLLDEVDLPLEVAPEAGHGDQ